MPGMNERKRWMRGETKTARGDYDKTKSYMGGGKIKGYKFGGKVKIGTGSGYVGQISDPIESATQATKKKKLRRR